MMTPPKAVLFDWDGTLVNSWPIIHESMNRTLEAMGHAPWSLDETLGRVRKSLREAFPELFGDRWEDARDVFYAAYREVHLERIERIDGAEELIAALHALGCHLGVVSNKSGGHLRTESTHLGWDRYFAGFLVGATDAPNDKPALDPVYMALRGTGIDPCGDVWFVGDTWVDIACGRAGKCRSILIGDKSPDDEEFRDHPPDEHFLTCRDLLEVVRRY
ncbi:MAG: HAD family hydrolase [Rhodospirillaceae bacterium]